VAIALKSFLYTMIRGSVAPSEAFTMTSSAVRFCGVVEGPLGLKFGIKNPLELRIIGENAAEPGPGAGEKYHARPLVSSEARPEYVAGAQGFLRKELCA